MFNTRNSKQAIRAKLEKVTQQLQELRRHPQYRVVISAYHAYFLANGERNEEARRLQPLWKKYYQQVWQTPEGHCFAKARVAFRQWSRDRSISASDEFKELIRQAKARLENRHNVRLAKPSTFDPDWLAAAWPVVIYKSLTEAKRRYEDELGGVNDDDQGAYAAARQIMATPYAEG